MANDTITGQRQGGKDNADALVANKNATDDGIRAAGDNRRAGDLDGNKTGGDSKSPGAAEAADDSDGEAAAGSKRKA